MGAVGKEWKNSATVYCTRKSMSTKSTATPDMTSPATSSQHLLKLEKKTTENAASDDFGSNLSGSGQVGPGVQPQFQSNILDPTPPLPLPPQFNLLFGVMGWRRELKALPVETSQHSQ